jgi:23S rRNA pseudouridine1911/1915/1917 synthase
MPVNGGEEISLTPPRLPENGAPRAQKMPLKIVHEDAALIVIDKPAGLVVHPGAGQPDRTLLNALLAHAPALAGVPRAGIVHRLDKDTSGLLVVAKTVEAQADLVRQLAERSMGRVYVALVQGDPAASGRIDAPVGRDAKARTRMAVTHRGKPALTTYRVLERFGRAALVECRLETGRTHQIRVHFQHIRHPLVGDTVYRRGTRHGLDFPRQALHAAELTLRHPSSGEQLTWRSPLPRDFKRLVDELRACAI